MTKLIAKKYRYADGVAYRDNLYDLIAFAPVGYGIQGETSKHVGGALVLKGKTIAWSGKVHGFRVKDIMAYSKAYVWGDTLTDALTKIKPQLQTECR